MAMLHEEHQEDVADWEEGMEDSVEEQKM